ncbi:MAG TPA: HNH endonuclease [Candidatus Brocadiaceae bacterium]
MLLLHRSGGVCECCGAAGSPDRHHLQEYSLGGGHELENLLLLCPACHRQIPKHLSLTQQQALQSWNQANVGGGNVNTTAQLRAIESSMEIGTVIFKSVKDVLRAYGQNIITFHKELSGIFMNIVMLEHFEPKLLVLSNKVIVNDGFTLQTSRDEVIVQDPTSATRFRVTGGERLAIRGWVKMRDETFRFDDEGFKFRGMYLKHVEIDCANTGFAAMVVEDANVDLNFGSARIRILRTPGS